MQGAPEQQRKGRKAVPSRGATPSQMQVEGLGGTHSTAGALLLSWSWAGARGPVSHASGNSER